MRNWVRIMLISMAVGLGLAIAMSIIFGIQFGSLLWIPFIIMGLAGLYLALPRSSRQVVTIIVGVLLVSSIAWSYWHEIDVHLWRPFFHMTWSVGQGHIDNQSTAERNLQADKTEKTLIKGALGADEDVTKILFNDKAVDSVATRLDRGTKNALRLKESIGRAAQAVIVDPLELARKARQSNRQMSSGSKSQKDTTVLSFFLQPGEVSQEIKLQDDQGRMYAYKLAFSNSFNVVVDGQQPVVWTQGFWQTKFKFQALPNKSVTINIKLFPYNV